MTTIGIANLGNRRDSEVRQGLDLMAQKAWVLAVVEAGDRWKMLNDFCRDHKWEVHHGDLDGASSTPILWNPRRVDVPHVGCRPSTPATYCGPLGAGPNTVKAKVINYIRVVPETEKHFSKDPFVLANLHMPASLYLPCRRRLGKTLIGDLDDMAERREGDVDFIAVGDFNARANSAILKPLRKQGMIQRVHFPTHGMRTIDHAWTLDRRASAEPLKQKFSDHRWVLLDVL